MSKDKLGGYSGPPYSGGTSGCFGGATTGGSGAAGTIPPYGGGAAGGYRVKIDSIKGLVVGGACVYKPMKPRLRQSVETGIWTCRRGYICAYGMTDRAAWDQMWWLIRGGSE